MADARLKWAAAGAAALAMAFAFNRWSTSDAEAEHPPEGEFVEVDGIRLHYIEDGDGDPIVLIHGNGSLVQDFVESGLFGVLAAKRRVIAFDRPGYGYSERPRGQDWSPERQADLFVAACAKLGIERPLVVGHSWGVLPALSWALHHRKAIAGLAVISGYFYGSPRLDALATGVAALPGLGDLYAQMLLPLQTRLTGPLGLKMVFSPEEVPDGFTERMPTGLMLRPAHLLATAADGGQMPIAAARLSKRYAELDLPMAIIWGEGDKLVPPLGQSMRLSSELPHAAPIVVAEAGHMLHHTHTEGVARAIDDLAAQAF